MAKLTVDEALEQVVSIARRAGMPELDSALVTLCAVLEEFHREVEGVERCPPRPDCRHCDGEGWFVENTLGHLCACTFMPVGGPAVLDPAKLANGLSFIMPEKP